MFVIWAWIYEGYTVAAFLLNFHFCYVPYVCSSSNAMKFMKNSSTELFATYMWISISIFCYVLYVTSWIVVKYCSRTFVTWEIGVLGLIYSMNRVLLFVLSSWFQYICSGLVFQIGIQCCPITCMFVKMDANRYKNCIVVLQNRIVLGCLKQCEVSLIYSYSDMYLPKAKNCYSRQF